MNQTQIANIKHVKGTTKDSQ